jgi:hypothetical protein
MKISLVGYTQLNKRKGERRKDKSKFMAFEHFTIVSMNYVFMQTSYSFSP